MLLVKRWLRGLAGSSTLEAWEEARQERSRWGERLLGTEGAVQAGIEQCRGIHGEAQNCHWGLSLSSSG